jgi:pyridoxine 5-phosphate synthase
MLDPPGLGFLRRADPGLVVAQVAVHDEQATLDFLPVGAVADRRLFVAPHRRHGLQVAGLGGVEELLDRDLGGRGTWLGAADRAAASGEQHEHEHERQSASQRQTPRVVGEHRAKMNPQRLYINIDHVATLRQARRAPYPDPVAAARLCEEAGADGITAHLREDRRHIQDADIEALAAGARTPFNLEIAATAEMTALALRLRPHQVTLVPERREEVTTEGGLDLAAHPARLEECLAALAGAGVRTSLFIDPDRDQIDRAARFGVAAIELHTGTYCHHPEDPRHLAALRGAARHAASLGLAVHAGHGLTLDNVGPVASIVECEELNIGHSVVGHAVFVGLAEAVRAMRKAMDAARAR